MLEGIGYSMRKSRLLAIVIIVIIVLVTVATEKLETATNANCTVLRYDYWFPNNLQEPYVLSNTTLISAVGKYFTKMSINESIGNTVTITGTTITGTGFPVNQWTETVCMYTG